MRRIDIINSVNKILKVLSDTKLIEHLHPHRDEIGKVATALGAFQKYSIAYQSFNNVDKQILNVFGLEGLEQPELWEKILIDNKNSVDFKIPYYRGILFINDYLFKITELLNQHNVDFVNNGTYVEAIQDGESNIITVILPENNNELSNPKRLINVLEGVDLLYSVVAKLNEMESDKLSVLSIDSGSDKSFDFFGAAKVVSSLKELFVDVWDRVVFFKEKKLHERLDLIAKSLPIIEKINNSEQRGTFGKEQAEILRRNIFDGINLFVKSGAILPEFEAHSSNSPRLLMTPEPKLLTSNILNDNDDNRASANFEPNQKNDDVPSLSSEEKDLLARLLEKESKRNKKKPKD